MFLLLYETSVYTVSFTIPPRLVATYDNPEVLKTHSNMDPHGISLFWYFDYKKPNSYTHLKTDNGLSS